MDVIHMDVIHMHEKPDVLRTPGNMIITVGHGLRHGPRLAPVRHRYAAPANRRGNAHKPGPAH
jgi:hypothetical protein